MYSRKIGDNSPVKHDALLRTGHDAHRLRIRGRKPEFRRATPSNQRTQTDFGSFMVDRILRVGDRGIRWRNVSRFQARPG